jgi:hypothetical protein
MAKGKTATAVTHTENNKNLITSPPTTELQVVGDHLAFEDQQTKPGVFVGNLH